MAKSKSKKAKIAKAKTPRKPVHPWRKCPLGKHWRRPHARKGTKGVRGHCVTNRSRKDQIYPEELDIISEKYFGGLIGAPINHALGRSQGNKFDHLIRGWTKYWNDVFKPKVPLDPNFVKAIIATESDFLTRAEIFAGKRAGFARGLMQITDWTIEILQDEKGELKNHLVNLTQKNAYNPNYNIASGIRWLFRKQRTASAKLGRDATWFEAALDYKGYLSLKKNPKQFRKLERLYEELTSRWNTSQKKR